MDRTFQKRNRTAVDGVGSSGDDSREPEIAAQPSTPPERTPLRNAISATALKLERSRDAAQAMKDHEIAKQEALAKTARLRAERLARDAKAASEAKLPVAKKK